MSKETVEQWMSELLSALPEQEPPDLPEKPAHEHGYLWSQCVRMLGSEDRAEAFSEWMNGQTMTWDEQTGETVIYPYDFERYMIGERRVYD